jgi:hypothetical protein
MAKTEKWDLDREDKNVKEGLRLPFHEHTVILLLTTLSCIIKI